MVEPSKTAMASQMFLPIAFQSAQCDVDDRVIQPGTVNLDNCINILSPITTHQCRLCGKTGRLPGQ